MEENIEEYSGEILPLVKWPNNALARNADIVPENEFNTTTLKNFVIDLNVTMRKYNGIGIAAPQVNVSKRIIIVTGPENRAFEMINPVLVVTSEERFNLEEGCLSLPTYFQRRSRPMAVQIAYRLWGGSHQQITATNMFAAIIQHEIDHLNGIMFVDDYIGDSKLKANRIKNKMAKGMKEQNRKN